MAFFSTLICIPQNWLIKLTFDMLRSSEIDTIRSGFKGRSFSVSWFWCIDRTCMASTTLLSEACSSSLRSDTFTRLSRCTCRSSGSAKQFAWVVLSCMSEVDPTQHYLQLHLQKLGHRTRHRTVHVFQNFSSKSTVEITRRLTQSASCFLS